ncbi:hypothetical protein BT96DRAFT_915593 [Gymnopus androsaceus JB14]|uniref:F-box domain-containing protein n=1 Tax=Gymnopus androsaceus JB14 TaxID=1447944 RepID=A0A6A4I5U9_9AGAR|nr:hypothetical protein BT96DRAFT_915593 [Gymnopus androsaceus JB14]
MTLNNPTNDYFNIDPSVLFFSKMGQYTNNGCFKLKSWVNATPAELANSIALWGVQMKGEGHEVAPDAQPLELARFSDFGLSGDAIPVECRDRGYLGVVKHWKDAERQLEVIYAITSPSVAPFKPENYRAHIPLMIISIKPRSGSEYSPREQSWSLSGTLCLEEPRQEVIAKGFEPETHVIAQFDQATLTPERKATVIVLSDPVRGGDIGDSRNLLRILKLYHNIFHHTNYAMTVTIEWTHTIVFRPDVSGLIKVLHIRELLCMICETLDLFDIRSLRATCKHFYAALAHIGARRLRKGLARAFGDAPQNLAEFEALLQSTGAIIGGSFALSLLCLGDWKPGDLDIIVDEVHSARIKMFLAQCQFVRDDERSQAPQHFYPNDDDSLNQNILFQIERFEHPEAGRIGIDLTILYPRSISYPAELILTYHSTIVMNFWNGKHIHCLWPTLTSNGIYIRNYQTPTLRVEKGLRKYRERGFKDKYDPEGLLLSVHSRSRQKLRYIQDDIPSCADRKLMVSDVPQPRWRMPLTLA